MPLTKQAKEVYSECLAGPIFFQSECKMYYVSQAQPVGRSSFFHKRLIKEARLTADVEAWQTRLEHTKERFLQFDKIPSHCQLQLACYLQVSGSVPFLPDPGRQDSVPAVHACMEPTSQ